MFTIALVGRPNVGKSTIYNSFLKKKSAITHDIPGVTRDRKEAVAEVLGMKFKVVDTAGYETEKKEQMSHDIAEQIGYAVDDADMLLLILDAKSGILPDDLEFINYVRKKSKPTLLVVNKSESKKKAITLNDIFKLGFEDICHLSAEHRIGYDDLYMSISNHYEKYQAEYGELEAWSKKTNDIKLTVVGKPNVGKSTFINSLLGKNRLITCDESGTTRDSIEIDWNYKGQDITLVDTAGIRKKAKINEKLERLSYDDSLKAVRFAEICILLFDATQKQLEKQDLSIISHIIDEGRGLIVALNKTDLLNPEELAEAIDEVKYQVSKYIPQNKNLKIWAVSAKNGRNIKEVVALSIEIYKNWNSKISTSNLNKWISIVTQAHPPALYKGRDLKFKYVTQIKTRPPTFFLTCNYPEQVQGSYIRYLKNSLMDNFGLEGVIPRFVFKKGANPYKNRKGYLSSKK